MNSSVVLGTANRSKACLLWLSFLGLTSVSSPCLFADSYHIISYHTIPYHTIHELQYTVPYHTIHELQYHTIHGVSSNSPTQQHQSRLNK